jgi:hypothetical protein
MVTLTCYQTSIVFNFREDDTKWVIRQKASPVSLIIKFSSNKIYRLMVPRVE